jgi:hypothetical protein
MRQLGLGIRKRTILNKGSFWALAATDLIVIIRKFSEVPTLGRRLVGLEPETCNRVRRDLAATGFWAHQPGHICRRFFSVGKQIGMYDEETHWSSRLRMNQMPGI